MRSNLIKKEIKLADELMYEAKASEALKKLLAIINDVPKDSNSQLRYEFLETLGEAYSENNMENKAIECFQEALSMNPKHKDLPFLYKSLGQSYSALGNDVEAIGYLEKALSAGENRSKFLLNILSLLSICHKNLDQFEKSITFGRRIIQEFYPPKDDIERERVYSAYLDLATCYWQIDDEVSASFFFDKLIMAQDVAPYILAGAYGIRGHQYFEKEDYEQARDCYDKAADYTRKDNSRDNSESLENWENWLKKAREKLS